jgi:hypothetical protein
MSPIPEVAKSSRSRRHHFGARDAHAIDDPERAGVAHDDSVVDAIREYARGAAPLHEQVVGSGWRQIGSGSRPMDAANGFFSCAPLCRDRVGPSVDRSPPSNSGSTDTGDRVEPTTGLVVAAIATGQVARRCDE